MPKDEPANTGAYGETIALSFLLQKGYTLIERNFHFQHKEIDLVMKDGQTIVFVEVKARSGDQFGTPAEAVTTKKRQNLLLAALGYCQMHHMTDPDMRFDVIEINLCRHTIRHIANAFGQNG